MSLFVVACGDEQSAESDDFAPRYSPPPDAQRGGELRVLASGDVDSLDPGQIDSQFSFLVSFATQRTLLSPAADNLSELIPDLARELPTVDRRSGLVEFRIRPDVRFSPPLSRRVVAADFEYAIERGLLPGVLNGYLEPYLGELRGFEEAERQVRLDPSRAPDISGVTAPTSDRLRLQFDGDVPPLAIAALSSPLAAPVPRGYAREYDTEVPSAYAQHVVSTGPYMVPNDEEGNLTGYRPGIEIELTRNPNWEAETDFRPAYLDRIEIESGFTNTDSASNRILNGRSQINGDFAPSPTSLREAADEHPDQLMMIPAGAVLYASLNTTIEPLDDVNVRRAVVAAADRTAMRLARGGTFVGPLATHFLPPGVPGFEEAGGFEGPDFDFLTEPDGDSDLAAEYMRRAGYPSGRYSGDERLLMVTDTTEVGRNTGEVVRRALGEVGIPVLTRAVSQEVMYSRFCNVPAADVAVCPNVGWIRLLNDPETVLEQTFNGDSIQPTNNFNWPQLDSEPINQSMGRAAEIDDPEDRARAWGRIDRMITAEAPAIPILWSKVPAISSENVVNVIDRTTAGPALPMISLTDGEG